MNVLFLYSEAMGYTMATIKEIIRIYGVQVHLVHWDKKKNTPYLFPDMGDSFHSYKRSETGIEKIRNLIDALEPKAIYCSGRMDKDYLKACLYAKKKGITTVSGFDSQWHGSIKNKIQALFAYSLYRRYFDYAWISGSYQFEYVRRLGFAKNKILWNLYSADTQKFQIETSPIKRFVFAGRFVPQKGILNLIEAFFKTLDIEKHDWELVLIGNGILKSQIPNHPKIKVSDFLQPDELAEEMKKGGVFVLPSLHEPWGVVVHEFACAGYPLICSDAVGSATAFLKHFYNGFAFPKNDTSSLAQVMLRFINMETQQLNEMSKRSKIVSQVITNEVSALEFGKLLSNGN
ncbi:MAG: glycosyltransferase family 4 protein [Cytophagales bacterium]